MDLGEQFKGWGQNLKFFFDERAESLGANPSFEDLCYVSGRDPRLWSIPGAYQDLIDTICTDSNAGVNTNLLEVGCAAGFIAYALSKRINRYTGVDITKATIRAARRLGLANAKFMQADGSKLNFSDGYFDSAICYDVFTNFPDFQVGANLIREMVRVVEPGGRILIGSLANSETQEDYERICLDVSSELEQKYGPVPDRGRDNSMLSMAKTMFREKIQGSQPQITCHYFDKDDFSKLGESLGCSVIFTDVPKSNPYSGYRFNAVFTRN